MAERDDWTGDKIRNIELARTYFGGVDEASTRELLAKLAETIDESKEERQKLSAERDRLAQRVRELEAALEDRVPEAPPQGYTEQALSEVIRTATERFDDALRAANEEADRMRTAASADAEALLADSRAEYEDTQRKAVELQQLLVNTSNQLFETLQTALAAVESLELAVPPAPQAEQLVQDLWPTADGDEEPSVSVEAAEEQNAEQLPAEST